MPHRRILAPIRAGRRLRRNVKKNIKDATTFRVTAYNPLNDVRTRYEISPNGVKKVRTWSEHRDVNQSPHDAIDELADVIIDGAAAIPKAAFDGFINALEWADRTEPGRRRKLTERIG